MTIEIETKPNEISHQENLIYEVRCFTCPDFSEEDGTIFNPPWTIADFTKNLTYEQALKIAQEHENSYQKQDEDHQLVVSYWDIGTIREALWKEG